MKKKCKGGIKRICRYLNYIFDYLQLRLMCSRKIRGIFENKTIAIVGSDPSLLDSGLGSKIDQYEVVIRINLLLTDALEKDLGYKSNYRFIGATMLPKHIKELKNIPNNQAIITTSKNRGMLDSLGIRYTPYPSLTPTIALCLLSEVCGSLESIEKFSRPPRSGIVLLSLILRFGHAKKITIFGFSLKEEGSLLAIGNNEEKIRKYDASKYVSNHCSPSIEISALHNLIENGYINVGDIVRLK